MLRTHKATSTSTFVEVVPFITGQSDVRVVELHAFVIKSTEAASLRPVTQRWATGKGRNSWL
jgi:hypothetical protein